MNDVAIIEKPTIGDILHVRTLGGPILALMIAEATEDGNHLVGITSRGHSLLVAPTDILAVNPACEYRGSACWYWTPNAVNTCQTCNPPGTDWEAIKQQLDRDYGAALDLLPPHDSGWPPVLALLKVIDAAIAAKDVPSFQRQALRLQAVINVQART